MQLVFIVCVFFKRRIIERNNKSRVPSTVWTASQARHILVRFAVFSTGGMQTISRCQQGASVSAIDLGIGQPDVLVAEDGETAFVSTDFSGFFDGQTFGITTIDISEPTLSILDRIRIAGAGFSPGADSPANFPIESAQSGNTLYVASEHFTPPHAFDSENRVTMTVNGYELGMPDLSDTQWHLGGGKFRCIPI